MLKNVCQSRIIRWVASILLLIAFTSDVYIDNTALVHQREVDLNAGFKHLSLVAKLLATEIEYEGLDGLTSGKELGWGSLDIFCVDIETGCYLTAPRFEPHHSNILEVLKNNDCMGVKCTTDQFNLLVSSGEPVVGAFLDYRLTHVISAGHIALVDGRRVAVFAEIDHSEITLGSQPNYMDEIIIGICILLTMSLVYDHFKLQTVNAKLEYAGQKLVDRYRKLVTETESTQVALEYTESRGKGPSAYDTITTIFMKQQREGKHSE